MSRWILMGIFVSLASSLNTTTVQATTYHVPDDFPNIQSALDAVNGGDIVIVRDGTWAGDLNRDFQFFGKDVVLQSENGPQACILDAAGTELENHRVFWIQGGESRDTVIEGFTITGGYMNGHASPNNEGGGILISDGSNPTIRKCYDPPPPRK